MYKHYTKVAVMVTRSNDYFTTLDMTARKLISLYLFKVLKERLT